MRIIRNFLLVLPLLLLAAPALFFHADLPADEARRRFALPDSRFLEVDDLSVHYLDRGSGTPVLLLHGTAASLHTWLGWMDELADDSLRLLALDLPAYGLTGPFPDRDYQRGRYLQFLDAFADRLRLDSFHIVGNSFGGTVAAAYAATRPNRVRGVVVIDPAGAPAKEERPTPLAIRMAEFAPTRPLVRWITPKALVRKSLLEVYVDDSLVTDTLVDRYHQLLLRKGNRRAYIDRILAPSFPFDSQLAGIRDSTLILWGAEDAWIPVRDTAWWRAAISQTRVQVFPGLGHVPMEEAPGETVGVVRGFLKD